MWKQISGAAGQFSALSTDPKPTNEAPGSICFETDTKLVKEFNGTDWPLHRSDGAQAIYALARSPVILSAGVYNANEVKGLMILVPGSADWSITGVDGAAQTIPVAAITAGHEWGVHLSTITVGTGGQALVYI